jgi:uncharacterized protein YecE (DUF72 family)
MHEPIEEFLGRARKLGPRIGPILYQLPPRWAFNRERLEEFLALLPRDLVHVFEFRETSWLTEDVLALLDARGIAFCAHDMPGAATPRWASGRSPMSASTAARANIGAAIPTSAARLDRLDRRQARQGRDVWCYFNNDIHAHAIDDALTLRSMVAQATPPAQKSQTSPDVR